MVQWWFENTRPKPPMGGIGAGFTMRRCSHWHLQAKKESLRWTFHRPHFLLDYPGFSAFCHSLPKCLISAISMTSWNSHHPALWRFRFQVSGPTSNPWPLLLRWFVRWLWLLKPPPKTCFNKCGILRIDTKKIKIKTKKHGQVKKQIFGWYVSKAFMNWAHILTLKYTINRWVITNHQPKHPTDLFFEGKYLRVREVNKSCCFFE